MRLLLFIQFKQFSFQTLKYNYPYLYFVRYSRANVFMQNFILYSLDAVVGRYFFHSKTFVNPSNTTYYNDIAITDDKGRNHIEEHHNILVKFGFIDHD